MTLCSSYLNSYYFFYYKALWLLGSMSFMMSSYSNFLSASWLRNLMTCSASTPNGFFGSYPLAIISFRLLSISCKICTLSLGMAYFGVSLLFVFPDCLIMASYLLSSLLSFLAVFFIYRYKSWSSLENTCFMKFLWKLTDTRVGPMPFWSYSGLITTCCKLLLPIVFIKSFPLPLPFWLTYCIECYSMSAREFSIPMSRRGFQKSLLKRFMLKEES